MEFIDRLKDSPMSFFEATSNTQSRDDLDGLHALLFLNLRHLIG